MKKEEKVKCFHQVVRVDTPVLSEDGGTGTVFVIFLHGIKGFHTPDAFFMQKN